VQTDTSRSFHDDDDENKPVWPSGLWAISQGGKTYSHQPHAHFVGEFMLSRRGLMLNRGGLMLNRGGFVLNKGGFMLSRGGFMPIRSSGQVLLCGGQVVPVDQFLKV
jgi:hypothetical protein